MPKDFESPNEQAYGHNLKACGLMVEPCVYARKILRITVKRDNSGFEDSILVKITDDTKTGGGELQISVLKWRALPLLRLRR